MNNLEEGEEAGWSDVELDYDYDPVSEATANYRAPTSKANDSKVVLRPQDDVNVYSEGIRDPMAIVFSLMNKESQQAAIRAGVPYFKELAQVPGMEQALKFLSSLKRSSDFLLEVSYTDEYGKTVEEATTLTVDKVSAEIKGKWHNIELDMINSIIDYGLQEGKLVIGVEFRPNFGADLPASSDSAKLYFQERPEMPLPILTNVTRTRLSHLYFNQFLFTLDVSVPFSLAPELKRYLQSR